MRAVRIPLFVLLAVLFFILWNRNAAAQSQKYLLTVTSRSAAYSART